ncbi:hypothetical protein Vretimale_11609, partial [Volvox reticuliferus]
QLEIKKVGFIIFSSFDVRARQGTMGRQEPVTASRCSGRTRKKPSEFWSNDDASKKRQLVPLEFIDPEPRRRRSKSAHSGSQGVPFPANAAPAAPGEQAEQKVTPSLKGAGNNGSLGNTDIAAQAAANLCDAAGLSLAPPVGNDLTYCASRPNLVKRKRKGPDEKIEDGASPGKPSLAEHVATTCGPHAEAGDGMSGAGGRVGDAAPGPPLKLNTSSTKRLSRDPVLRTPIMVRDVAEAVANAAVTTSRSLRSATRRGSTAADGEDKITPVKKTRRRRVAMMVQHVAPNPVSDAAACTSAANGRAGEDLAEGQQPDDHFAGQPAPRPPFAACDQPEEEASAGDTPIAAAAAANMLHTVPQRQQQKVVKDNQASSKDANGCCDDMPNKNPMATAAAAIATEAAGEAAVQEGNKGELHRPVPAGVPGNSDVEKAGLADKAEQQDKPQHPNDDHKGARKPRSTPASVSRVPLPRKTKRNGKSAQVAASAAGPAQRNQRQQPTPVPAEEPQQNIDKNEASQPSQTPGRQTDVHIMHHQAAYVTSTTVQAECTAQKSASLPKRRKSGRGYVDVQVKLFGS